MPDVNAVGKIKGRGKDGYPFRFLLLYILFFAGNAVYNPFITVYLDQVGLSRSLIGILMAIGLGVAMGGQLFWGLAGDRAKYKNTVLMLLFAGTAAAIILYPLSTHVLYIILMTTVFMFFQSSIMPLIDTVALEHLEGSRWKFGPIRMGGTLSFAAVALLAGVLLIDRVERLFPLYFVILVMGFLLVLLLPGIRGHQSHGVRLSPGKLLKDRKLLILLGFSLAIQLTLGFYYSFFPIHVRDLGGTNLTVGWAMCVSAASEVPFLLSAHWLVRRFGITWTLIVSAGVTSLRWLILFSIGQAWQFIPANAMHGLTYIVFAYCLSIYVSKEVPRELKASGQALHVLVGMGLARIIGNIGGGAISDRIGIRWTFLVMAAAGAVATLFFGAWLLRHDRKHAPAGAGEGEDAGTETETEVIQDL